MTHRKREVACFITYGNQTGSQQQCYSPGTLENIHICSDFFISDLKETLKKEGHTREHKY